MTYEETEATGARALTEAIEIIEGIEMLYATYVIEDDSKLTKDGQELERIVSDFANVLFGKIHNK